MENTLILFRRDNLNPADFLISKFPVSRAEFAEVTGAGPAGPGDGGLVKKASLAEALRYCNLLSARHGLPPAYDEEYCLVLDAAGEEVRPPHLAAGFRLPTRFEWQQAAVGALNGERFGPGGHLETLNRNFYLKDWAHAPGGCEELARLDLNPAGLAGMLRPDMEWSGDTCYGPDSFRGAGWVESVGRDDKFFLEVQDRAAAPGTPLPFRVVRTAPVS